MILSQISYLDCIVFVLLLIPQLLLRIPITELLKCGINILPFLVLRLPFEVIHERYFTPHQSRSPFCQRATVFQDIVIRCVRYAFANFPSNIGRVFFSKPVALPFARFRMLRHGYLSSSYPWQEVVGPNECFRGVYVTSPKPSKSTTDTDDPSHSDAPDIILYYLHGGGFSMGSSYFYLEFLLALCTLLRERAGFRNPAVLGLEYTLVPDQRFPVQAEQTRAGFEWCVEHVVGRDPDRVAVAGDSAGATLALGLLVGPAMGKEPHQEEGRKSLQPGFATLLSPWCVLVSPKNRDTPSDYLNTETLHLYAKQYAGADEEIELKPNPQKRVLPALRERNGNGVIIKPANTGLRRGRNPGYLTDPVASPGLIDSPDTWRRATPRYGFHFVFGSEEVFGPDARGVIERIRGAWSDHRGDIAKDASDGDKHVNGAANGKANDALQRKGVSHRGGMAGEDTAVVVTEEEGGIHAWPVVNLFLGESKRERMRGVERIVDIMAERMRGGAGSWQ